MGADKSKGARMARLVFELMINGRKGVIVDRLFDEFGIAERTRRQDRQELSYELEPLLSSYGMRLEDTKTPQGRLLRVVSLREDDESGAQAEVTSSVASFGLMQNLFESLGLKEASELAQIEQESSSRRTDVFKFASLDRKVLYVPQFQVQYDGQEDTVKYVLRAIFLQRALKFSYQGANDFAPRNRSVRPYTLLLWKGAFYLYGARREDSELRLFALQRMQDVQIDLKQEPFPYPQEHLYDPAGIFRQRFGIYDQDAQRRQEVVIRFAPNTWLHRYIRERNIHSTAVLEDMPDGELQLTMRLGALDECIAWVNSFGDDARFVKPEELAQAAE